MQRQIAVNAELISIRNQSRLSLNLFSLIFNEALDSTERRNQRFASIKAIIISVLVIVEQNSKRIVPYHLLKQQDR